VESPEVQSLAHGGRGTKRAQLQRARAGEDLTHASSMAKEILRGRASLSVVCQPIICQERCKSAVISSRAVDRLIWVKRSVSTGHE